MVVFVAFVGYSLGTGGEADGPSGATSSGDRVRSDERKQRRSGRR
jgi:hypothetical protein